jgi:hypothetical protein
MAVAGEGQPGGIGENHGFGELEGGSRRSRGGSIAGEGSTAQSVAAASFFAPVMIATASSIECVFGEMTPAQAPRR